MNAVNAIENMQDKAVEMANHVEGAAVRGTRRFMDATERLFDKSKGLARSMDNCVHDHTWAALGIVAAVGIILGLAVSRR